MAIAPQNRVRDLTVIEPVRPSSQPNDDVAERYKRRLAARYDAWRRTAMSILRPVWVGEHGERRDAETTPDAVIRRILDERPDTDSVARLARGVAGETDRRQRGFLENLIQHTYGMRPDFDQSYEPGLAHIFAQRNVQLITDVDRDFEDEVRGIVVEKWRAGEPWERAADDIEKRLKVPRSRAELIAVDQTQKAQGQWARYRQRELGIEAYVWKTMLDSRVRPSHRLLHNQRFTWSSPPGVGHPGQPIRCRCQPEPDVLTVDLDKLKTTRLVSSDQRAFSNDFLSLNDLAQRTVDEDMNLSDVAHLAKANKLSMKAVGMRADAIRMGAPLPDAKPFDRLVRELRETDDINWSKIEFNHGFDKKKIQTAILAGSPPGPAEVTKSAVRETAEEASEAIKKAMKPSSTSGASFSDTVDERIDNVWNIDRIKASDVDTTAGAFSSNAEALGVVEEAADDLRGEYPAIGKLLDQADRDVIEKGAITMAGTPEPDFAFQVKKLRDSLFDFDDDANLAHERLVDLLDVDGKAIGVSSSFLDQDLRQVAAAYKHQINDGRLDGVRGLRIQLERGGETYYNPIENRIRVYANASRFSIQQSLVHEFGHILEAQNTRQGEAAKRVLLSAVAGQDKKHGAFENQVAADSSPFFSEPYISTLYFNDFDKQIDFSSEISAVRPDDLHATELTSLAYEAAYKNNAKFFYENPMLLKWLWASHTQRFK